MEPSTASTPRAIHSPDWCSIRWFGTLYHFTPMQSEAIKALWAAWESGCPDLRQGYILDQAGSASGKLSILFAHHPAWNTLIVPSRLFGGGAGCYRLHVPEVAHQEAEILTAAEVATILGVSVAMIKNLAKADRLPCTLTDGKYLFPVAELAKIFPDTFTTPPVKEATA